jgi:hypothetical protein
MSLDGIPPYYASDLAYIIGIYFNISIVGFFKTGDGI